jgi:hypothetical protein
MVEENTSSVPVPLLGLTSKICAEHYWGTHTSGGWAMQRRTARQRRRRPPRRGGQEGAPTGMQGTKTLHIRHRVGGKE